MSQLLLSPLQFLIVTLFDLYIMLVMLRFLLQWVRADFYNPMSQFIVKLTSPALLPLRRYIPGWFGVDMAALVLALALQFIALLLMHLMGGGTFSPVALLLLSIVEIVALLFNIFMVTIIVQSLMSWVNPMADHHPLTALLATLNAPLLRPARRYIPAISGIDLSPLAVLLALQMLKMALIPPLRYLLG
ncbi:MAG: YggT family protein [Gammaproteobacteria bacterium]|nr:YggT family protein [Gammaproteobacteria bacterium]